ncbi:unnamed protein product, partial [marine sediment metagenome]
GEVEGGSAVTDNPLAAETLASAIRGVARQEQSDMPGYGCLVDSIDTEREEITGEETSVVWHLSRRSAFRVSTATSPLEGTSLSATSGLGM